MIQSLSMATSIINTLQVHYGLGRHIDYLGTYEISMVFKTLLISQLFSTFSSCFAKISVALLLKRLMNRHKIQEIFLYFLIASLLIVNTILNIETFARCTPAEALWNICLSDRVTIGLAILQGGMFGQVNVPSFRPLLIVDSMVDLRRLHAGALPHPPSIQPSAEGSSEGRNSAIDVAWSNVRFLVTTFDLGIS